MPPTSLEKANGFDKDWYENIQIPGIDAFAASIDRLAASQGWHKATSTQNYAELLLDFPKTVTSTLSSPSGVQVISTHVLPLVTSYPFLLHAILALTAAHMTCVAGRGDDFAAAAIFHTQASLTLYTARLDRLDDRAEMDAMLATCFMLTALFYLSHDRLHTTASWVFPCVGAARCATRWHTIISGPALLLRSAEFTRSAERSIWFPFMQQSMDLRACAVCRGGPGESAVTLLREVIDESAAGDARTRSYLSALEVLAPVIRAHFDPATGTFSACNNAEDFVSLVLLPSQLCPTFFERLEEYDHIALLLIGFWFALLARLQHCQWWCLRRSLAEGSAICLFLGCVESPGWRFEKALGILQDAFKG